MKAHQIYLAWCAQHLNCSEAVLRARLLTAGVEALTAYLQTRPRGPLRRGTQRRLKIEMQCKGVTTEWE